MRRSGTRRATDLRPECIPLGFLSEKPAHGYELFREFKSTLGGLWHISESQMYATLQRLQKRGLVSVARVRKGAAAESRVLSLTGEGRTEFEKWLRTSTVCVPRLLRLEYITRVFFAYRRNDGTLDIVMQEQERELQREIQRLESLAEAEDGEAAGLDVARMMRTFRLDQVRAAFAWIRKNNSGIGGVST